MPADSVRPTRRLATLLTVWSLTVLGAVGLAAAAPAAAAPLPLPPGCTINATELTATCTFTETGEHALTIPAGVTSLHVITVGGRGGGGFYEGGHGASVTADVVVTEGSTVYAEVGIGGGTANRSSLGGGASDLRTCSTSAACGDLGTDADPRLLVAGGGGGTGLAGSGGTGGHAGVGAGPGCHAGSDGDDATTAGSNNGEGGLGAGCTTGGAGGLGAPASAGAPGGALPGTNGSAGLGGDGAPGGAGGQGGGGGGGGYYGGGGGGGNTGDGPGNSGGGGGGSSYAASPTDGVTNVTIELSEQVEPSVTITFDLILDHIVVIPATAIVPAGGSQTYTAEAVGADNYSFGDVTAETTFGIADGTCTDNACTSTNPGDHQVTGTFRGQTATATLTVTAAAPASIAVVGGDDTTAETGSPFPELSVQVRDEFANPVPGATVTWTVDSGEATFASTTSTTDDTGTATAPTLTAGSASQIEVTASTTGATPATFTLTAFDPLTVTTTSLPGGTAGETYHTELVATGGQDSTYTWSISEGALPDGLSLDATTGVISGTPTTAGTYRFTVSVNDPATQSLTLTIEPQAVAPTPPPPPAPEPPAAEPPLAATGSDVSPALVGGAAAVLLAGALLMVGGFRNRTSKRFRG